MVGRLIEQQYVGVAEQRLGQQHAEFPARRDNAHRLVVLFEGNAQAQQQLAGTGLGGIAVELGEAHFEIGDRHAIFFTHLACE